MERLGVALGKACIARGRKSLAEVPYVQAEVGADFIEASGEEILGAKGYSIAETLASDLERQGILVALCYIQQGGLSACLSYHDQVFIRGVPVERSKGRNFCQRVDGIILQFMLCLARDIAEFE